ncbi:MAG: helix-turn-helix domain-containing protein [Thermoplasmatota archaeon]
MWATLLKVQNPACAWCHTATLSEPGVEVRVLAHFPANDGTVWEEAELVGPSWSAQMEKMRGMATVGDLVLLEGGPDRARVRMRVSECPLHLAVAASGVLPRFPFEVRQGYDEWLLICEKDATNKFVNRLRENGTEVQILSAKPYRQEAGLTDRQREIMDAAVDQGYFEVPRRVTLTKLADRLGIAKSTLSEILARGEKHLLEELHSRGE